MSAIMDKPITNLRISSQGILDINAGFAYLLDCLVTLFVIGSVLSGWFSLPSEIVFGRIVPGAIVGVIVGNILLAVLARRTRLKTGNANIAAIPIGPDIVSVLTVSFFIIGPAYQLNIEEMGAEQASLFAWKLGMAVTLWVALIKFICAVFGRAIVNVFPIMALLASLSAVAIVWLGAESVNNIFAIPAIGLISLVIMLYSLTSGHRLPFRIPGAAFAFVAATLLYYLLASFGNFSGYIIPDVPEILPVLPYPTLAWSELLFGPALNYLGVATPIAILVVVFAINIVAGAKAVGDEYDARNVIAIDAIATTATALFGGVAQTTPYGGHATYRRMGGRLNYTVIAVSVIGVAGFLGFIGFGSLMIPDAVLKPILVIVACDIVLVAFSEGKTRHAPAFMIAIIPAVFNYAHTKTAELYQAVNTNLNTIGIDVISVVGGEWHERFMLLGVLSNGYILTSLLWGALVVWIIEGKFRSAACICFACSIFSLFGVIHSVLATSGMYLPWNLSGMEYAQSLPYQMAAAYACVGTLLCVFWAIGNKEAVT